MADTDPVSFNTVHHKRRGSHIYVGNLTMRRKRFLYIAITFSCLLYHHDAFCSETYYVDGNRVLLYKVINWWYDCLPQDSELLCGSPLRYHNEGNARLEYNEGKRVLKIHIQGGFSELISAIKQCNACFGPSYLKCNWLNDKYFGNGEADVVRGDLPSIHTLIINKVGKKQARRTRAVEDEIAFSIEGVIGGLLNGKVALYGEGDFLKSCHRQSQHGVDRTPAFLKIFNVRTGEALATYAAVWAN